MITKSVKKKVASKKENGKDILEKMLADRKLIKAHLAKGGTLEELKDKGFHFAPL
jgi:hypothetical protein